MSEREISKNEDVRTELNLAPMHRIARKSGIERVSEGACRELAIILEKLGIQICKEAQQIMMHSRRKTVKADDIKVASRKMLRNRR